MKVRLNKNELITNATDIIEFQLPNDDQAAKAVLMSIISTNKYSDGMLAVLRETIANAVDAHREVGKEDVPIEITLPTSEDPCVRIRDYGAGISRELIEKVYTRPGVSTKSSRPNQQGGYGIGALALLAPCSQATVNTFYDGVKYTYVLFLRENIPVLALMGEIESDEPSGTEVEIPLGYEEIRNIQHKLTAICAHLKPTPNITNCGTTREMISNAKEAVRGDYSGVVTVLLPGEDREIQVEWEYVSKSASSTASLVILNDFVSYNFYDSLDFRDSNTNEGIYFYGGNTNKLILKYPVGELDLPSDRESLQDTEHNTYVVTAAAQSVVSQLRSIVEETISKQETLVDAVRLASKSPWKNFTWQGKLYTLDEGTYWTPTPEDQYLGIDSNWNLRVGAPALISPKEHSRIKDLFKNQSNKAVINPKNRVSIANLLDYPLYVIEHGMTSKTFLKLAGLPIDAVVLFTVVNDAEEWLDQHPQFKLLGAKAIKAPETKKRKKESDAQKVFRSLVRGNGAVRKITHYSEYRSLWDCITDIAGHTQVPDSGYYLSSDWAKQNQVKYLGFVQDLFSHTYVFQPRLVDVISEININARVEGKPEPWVDLVSVVKQRACAFLEFYKDVFQRTRLSIDSFIFGDSDDYKKLQKLLTIPSVADILDPDRRLSKLLAEPSLFIYRDVITAYGLHLKFDWMPKDDLRLERLLSPVYDKYPLLAWSRYEINFNQNYYNSVRQYIELIDKEKVNEDNSAS